MARLAAASPIPLAGGEGECAAPPLIRMIAAGALDVVQIDVTRMGITPALRVLDAAETRGSRIASHSFTSALNVAAHLHLLAVARGEPIAEWPTAPLALWADVLDPSRIRDGAIARLPDAAGVGIPIA